MSRILINASNLHGGGGVQVASSFISELTRCSSLPENLVIWASSEVHDNLLKLGCDSTALPAYERFDAYGIRQLLPSFSRRLRGFCAVFTIFGPLYAWPAPKGNIAGFAQPWIIYPENEVYWGLDWAHRLMIRSKYWIQSQFFRRADVLIVEAEHVRRELITSGLGSDDTIRVVRNCLSSIYSTPDRWSSLRIRLADSDFNLGFVGRNYPHKNTKIFPAVKDILARKYGLNVNFYVTFTSEEWDACSPAFRRSVVNVGPLSVTECPAFYSTMGGVIFPSLLECFSATPLEAMAMRRPLFASDRPFNRDICLGHARYFDPVDPGSAAEAIAVYLREEESPTAALEEACAHAMTFSSAAERARLYLGYLLQVAEFGKL